MFEPNTKIERTFEIREERMAELQEKIDGLNKKAAKLGVAPVSFKVVKTVLKPVLDMEGRPTEEKYAVHVITVEGEAPKLPGWTFDGVVEHTAAGNIIKVVPGHEIDPKYREAKPVCDHCKHARRRKETFILRHESGDVKQIGRQCIRDFLGGTTPEHIAMLLQFAVSIGELGDDEGSWGGNVVPVYTFHEILAKALVFVKRYGFISRAAANASAEKSTTTYLTTTAEQVLHIPKTQKDKDWLKDHLPSAEDHQDADKVIEWIGTLAGISDYEHNLKIVAGLEFFKHDKIGIAVSAAGVWAKEQGKAKVREAKLKEDITSEWVGEVGARQVMELILVDIKDLGENAWGSHSVLHRFKDTNGNVFTWFASRDAVGEVGQTVKVKATIKKHDDYKGIKQTILSRCTKLDF